MTFGHHVYSELFGVHWPTMRMQFKLQWREHTFAFKLTCSRPIPHNGWLSIYTRRWLGAANWPALKCTVQYISMVWWFGTAHVGATNSFLHVHDATSTTPKATLAY